MFKNQDELRLKNPIVWRKNKQKSQNEACLINNEVSMYYYNFIIELRLGLSERGKGTLKAARKSVLYRLS